MPYFLKKYYPLRNIVFVLGEGVLIFLALFWVYSLLIDPEQLQTEIPLIGARALTVTVIFQLCLYYFDLYNLSAPAAIADMTTRFTQALGVGCILLGFLYYFIPSIIISARIFLAGCVAILLSIGVWRFFYAKALDNKLFTQSIVLLGGGMLAERIFNEIEGKRDSGYSVVACINETRPAFATDAAITSDDVRTLQTTALATKADKIIVALDDKPSATCKAELLTCKLQGIPIVEGIGFYESLTGKIIVEQVTPDWIIFSDGFTSSHLDSLIKSSSDILIAFVGLIILSPLALLLAILIKLDSSGPVFYIQERVGLMGKVFKLVKFRSMRVEAEADGQPKWADLEDHRVTRVGRLMRNLRLDEIPQLWNVLRGEMSFIGPRPERPFFVDTLSKQIPYYALRHHIKPGVSGWAQTCYGYGASVQDALRKLEFDLYYIKNMSIWLDMLITFKTVKIIFFQIGSR